jgi:hypothetical protein
VEAGLSQISANETHTLMNADDLGKARESRGILWLAADILKLKDEMAVIKNAEKDANNVAKQSTRK